MKRQIPGRLSRRERIKLLLATLKDAQDETGNQLEGRSKLGPRYLNHGHLYREGSYHDLNRSLDNLKRKRRDIHWYTIEVYCNGVKTRCLRRKAELGLEFLMLDMPTNIFVPDEISENAGFNASEARIAARPRLQRAA